MIDLGILCLLVFLIFLVASFFMVLSGGSGGIMGPVLVAFFILTWGYGAFCEGIFNGRTVGKVCLGIRVVSDRGIPISGAQAVLRNLVGAIDGLIPFFFQLGLASMTLSPRFQRLGDLAAGTMVVREERRSRRGFVRDQGAAGRCALAVATQPHRGWFRPGTHFIGLRRGQGPLRRIGALRARRAAGQDPATTLRAVAAGFRRCGLVRGVSPRFHRRVSAADGAT